jgi:class 3 adenylate cyclase
VERRLSAILAADVAGYSRLMGMDEEGTLVQLKGHRQVLVDPQIEEHRGRIWRADARAVWRYFMIQRIRTDETSCRSLLTIRFPRDKHLIPPAANPRPVSFMGIVGARRPEFSKLKVPFFSCNSLTPVTT